MPAPEQVVRWLEQTYPRPRIDAEWLDACCDWIISELSLDSNSAADLPRLISNVDSQLLQSDLRDSAVAGTGLPATVSSCKSGRLTGAPVLVEIAAITEIGHSAFQLQSIRQTRVDREDLAGLNATRGEDGQAEEEDEGPIPKYPRSMLRFELTDGSMTIKAVEHRRIPELVLGDTPLGYKLLLKNVMIRRGIAFLEPATVILKGYQTEDREINQDSDFVRSLRIRMGLPEVDPDALTENRPSAPAPAPAPAPAIPAHDPTPAAPAPMPNVPHSIAAPPPPSNPPPPFRDLSPSEMEAFFDDTMDERDDIRTKPRNVPPPPPANTTAATTGPNPQPPTLSTTSTQSTLVASRYWSSSMEPGPSLSSATAGPGTLATLASERILSPRGRVPLFLPDDDDVVVPTRAAPAAPMQGKNLARTDGEGSEYSFADDSLVMDDAALAALAVAEQAASQPRPEPSSQVPERVSPATRSEVIMVDSDEDIDDGKENVPVATRNVRSKSREELGVRRGRSAAPTPAPASDDVIDISD